MTVQIYVYMKVCGEFYFDRDYKEPSLERLKFNREDNTTCHI